MDTPAPLPRWQKGMFIVIVFYLVLHWLSTYHLVDRPFFLF